MEDIKFVVWSIDKLDWVPVKTIHFLRKVCDLVDGSSCTMDQIRVKVGETNYLRIHEIITRATQKPTIKGFDWQEIRKPTEDEWYEGAYIAGDILNLPDIDKPALWLYDNGMIGHDDIDKDENPQTIFKFLNPGINPRITHWCYPIYPVNHYTKNDSYTHTHRAIMGNYWCTNTTSNVWQRPLAYSVETKEYVFSTSNGQWWAGRDWFTTQECKELPDE